MTTSDNSQEHAVIVRFRRTSGHGSPLFDLELNLALALAKSGTGWYDGHEFTADRSSGRLFMYGPDADALLESIRPALESAAGIYDVVALLRYGSAGNDVERVSVVIERSTLPG